MDNDIIFESWVESQRIRIREWKRTKSKKKFIGERGYLHFDGKVSFKYHIDTNAHSICNILRDPNKIKEHRFLPFIRDDLRVRRYRSKGPFDAQGQVRLHTDRFTTIKNRPIMYAAHRDACIYSMYGYVINEAYEAEIAKYNLNENVLAYRRIQKSESSRNKSNIDFAKDFFDKLSNHEESALIMIDVSSFFDTINHKKLAEKWSKLLGGEPLAADHLAVLKSLTKFRYVFKNDIHSALGLTQNKLQQLSKKAYASLCSPRDFNSKIKKNKLIKQNRSGYGIPQGSPISGLIANLYMLDFDIKMREYVEIKNHGHYGRYSDDIIILIAKDKIAEAYGYAKKVIENENLEIKDKKTEAFVFKKNIGMYTNALDLIGIPPELNHKEHPQYLGFSFGAHEMTIRSSTLVRRFRGRHRLNENRWDYFRLARIKTASRHMSKQIQGVRNKIKKLTSQINEPGKNYHPKFKKKN